MPKKIVSKRSEDEEKETKSEVKRSNRRIWTEIKESPKRSKFSSPKRKMKSTQEEKGSSDEGKLVRHKKRGASTSRSPGKTKKKKLESSPIKSSKVQKEKGTTKESPKGKKKLKEKEIEEEESQEDISEVEEEKPKKKKSESPGKGLFSSLLTEDDLKKLPMCSPLRPIEKKKPVEKKIKFNEKIWNRLTSAPFIEVDEVGRHAQHVGQDGHVGLVQSEVPFQKSDGDISYFEVTIEASDSQKFHNTGILRVGLTPENYPKTVHIGRAKNSIGYDSRGVRFCMGEEGSGSAIKGKPFGAPFGTTDTIGCGLDHESGNIFFTKNGEFQGNVVMIDTRAPFSLYPSVSLSLCYVGITLNYGQEEFKYDIKGKAYQYDKPASIKILRPTFKSVLFEESPVSSPTRSPFTTPRPVEKKNMIFPCGLFDKKNMHPITLQKTEIKTNIRNFVAEITVIHTFENNQNFSIEEAIYLFPLTDMSSLSGVNVELNGKQIVSNIVESSEKNVLESFITAVPKSFLLEPISGDLFKLVLQDILPKREIKVEISYFTELKEVGRQKMRLLIPHSVVPKYKPLNLKDVDVVTDSQATDTTLTNLLTSFHLNIASSCPISTIECSSGSEMITLREKFTFEMDIEIELNKTFWTDFKFVSDPEFHYRMLLESNKRPPTVGYMLSCIPTPFVSESSLEFNANNDDFIFLEHHSILKDRAKLEQIENILYLLVRSLPPGCHFQIISNGEKLFKSVSKYDEKALEQAEDYIDKMKENTGDSSLLEPLEDVLTSKLRGNRKHIILITDTQVSEKLSEEIVNLILTKRTKNNFLFTIGLGENINRMFLINAARVGQGRAEFITPTEDVQMKTLRQLKRAVQTPQSVKISWPEGNFTQIPHEIPKMFVGDTLNVFSLMHGANIPDTISLSFGEKEIEMETLLVEEGSVIQRLAAKCRIRALEEKTNEYYELDGNLVKGKTEHEILDEKKQLALRYKLITPYTSLIIVQKGKKKKGVQKFPVSWHRLPSLKKNIDRKDPLFEVDIDIPQNIGFEDIRTHGEEEAELFDTQEEQKKKKMKDKVKELIRKQFADGHWKFEEDLAELLDVSWTELQQNPPPSVGNHNDSESKKIWATSLCTAFFSKFLEERKEEWEMLSMKAKQWLSKNLKANGGESLNKVLEAAGDFLDTSLPSNL